MPDLTVSSAVDNFMDSATQGEMQVAVGVRETLAANRTYYVRSDGSDSNTGLVDSAGGAFLTLQKAVDVVAGLDRTIYTVTIKLAAGTWTQNLVLKEGVGALAVVIEGATTTPGDTIITSSSGSTITTLGAKDTYQFKDVRLSAATSGNAFFVSGPTAVEINNVEFAAITSGRHIFIEKNCTFTVAGNYSIIGGATEHILTQWNGQYYCISRTVTLTGTPAFGGLGFAAALLDGKIDFFGTTFSGSATGVRHNAQTGGIIRGVAAGLPGGSSGTATAPGVYTT